MISEEEAEMCGTWLDIFRPWRQKSHVPTNATRAFSASHHPEGQSLVSETSQGNKIDLVPLKRTIISFAIITFHKSRLRSFKIHIALLLSSFRPNQMPLHRRHLSS
jgi:hypothetical protein